MCHCYSQQGLKEQEAVEQAIFTARRSGSQLPSSMSRDLSCSDLLTGQRERLAQADTGGSFQLAELCASTVLCWFVCCFFSIVCFTSYFVFSIAVLPHSPGVVYYHLI